MDAQPQLENDQDLTKRAESSQKHLESQAENIESKAIQGAEILETPVNGDFIIGLKAFISWVSSLVAKDK